MSMEHTKAVETNATERYLLGEMSGGERDEFEAHYFDCAACAEEVKSGATLIDNAREVFRGEAAVNVASPKPVRRSSGNWLGFFRPAYGLIAIAVLAAIVGYQNLVTIPNMRHASQEAATALPSLSLVTAGTRSGEISEIKIEAQSPFGIYVDIPNADAFESFSCNIVSQGGTTKLSIPVSTAQAKDTVQLLVPGGTLGGGSYALVIEGRRSDGASQEVARYSFVLKTK